MSGVTIQWKYFRKEKVKELLGFGAYTSMSFLSATIYDNAINILINRFWGPAYNAIYGVSSKFPILMRRLFIEPTWTLTPTFTHLVAKGEKEKLEKLLFTYCKIMAILSLPVLMVLILAAKPIIQWWVGPDFSLSAKIMPVQLIPFLIGIPCAACICVINAYGKVKLPAVRAILSVMLRLVLGIILAKGLSMGLMGIVLGSTIFLVVFLVIYNSNYACSLAKISLARFWKEVYLRPVLLTGCVVWAGAFLMPGFFEPGFKSFSLMGCLVGGILALGYASGVYFFVMNREDRQYLSGLFDDMKCALSGKPKRPVVEEEPIL
jgi:O-antigen/teichoic acid export membrane protein